MLSGRRRTNPRSQFTFILASPFRITTALAMPMLVASFLVGLPADHDRGSRGGIAAAAATPASRPAVTRPYADVDLRRTSSGVVTGKGMQVNQMPTTSTRGFRHVGGVDFRTAAKSGRVAKPEGNRSPSTYGKWLLPYGDWSGTVGGQYRFQDNVSVHDGVLEAKFRTIRGRNTGSAWIWKHPRPTYRNYGFTYGAVEQRIRVKGTVRGYGAANILWPDSERWGDGEIDFPEGEFSKRTRAYHHCLGKRPVKNCSVFKTGKKWSAWHVYRIEWRPSGTSYYIDGKLIGTNRNATPKTSHHWVTQMSIHTRGKKSAKLKGSYLVDWARFESLA